MLKYFKFAILLATLAIVSVNSPPVRIRIHEGYNDDDLIEMFKNFTQGSRPASRQYSNMPPPPPNGQYQSNKSGYHIIKKVDENTNMTDLLKTIGEMLAEDQFRNTESISNKFIRLCCDDNEELTNCEEMRDDQDDEDCLRKLVVRQSAIYAPAPDLIKHSWSENIGGRGGTHSRRFSDFTDPRQNYNESQKPWWKFGKRKSISSSSPKRFGSFDSSQFDDLLPTEEQNITRWDETPPPSRPYNINNRRTDNGFQRPSFQNSDSWGRSPSRLSTASSGYERNLEPKSRSISNGWMNDPSAQLSKTSNPAYEFERETVERPPRVSYPRFNNLQQQPREYATPAYEPKQKSAERSSRVSNPTFISRKLREYDTPVPESDLRDTRRPGANIQQSYSPRGSFSWGSQQPSDRYDTGARSWAEKPAIKASPTNSPSLATGNIDFLKIGNEEVKKEGGLGRLEDLGDQRGRISSTVDGKPDKYTKDKPNKYKPINLTEFRKQALERHNWYRIKHDRLPFVMDPKLNESALAYAEHLAKNDPGGRLMKHSPLSHTTVGENLMFTSHRMHHMAYLGVDEWWAELRFFSEGEYTAKQLISMIKNAGVGHLTQLLWDDSRKLGCAFARSEIGRYYYVCHYLEPGNVTGEKYVQLNLPLRYKKEHILQAKLFAEHLDKLFEKRKSRLIRYPDINSEEDASDFGNANIEDLLQRLVRENGNLYD